MRIPHGNGLVLGPPPIEVPRGEDHGKQGLPYATWPLVRTVLGVVAGLLLGSILLPAPVAILDPGLDSYAGLIAAQALLGAAFLGTALVVADDRRNLFVALSRLGVRRFRVSAIWTVLAAYLTYLVALALYASLLVSPDQQDIARDLGLDSNLLLTIVSVALIAGLAPIAEELFFRGMFFAGLRTRLSFLPAALISGAVFGSLHLPTGPSTVPPLIFFGFLLAWVYARSGSIWPAVIMHAINNSLALAVSG
ncbi:MAG: lysostaphin resistance A-like protein [Solirubrobacterales bacterium]